MNLIRTNGLVAIGRVSLFVAIGALLGYVQMLLETRLDETPGFQPDLIKVLFALVLVQCLIIIAALASWKFAVGDTYWKAPVLYFLVILSALLMLVFLLRFIPDDIMNDLPVDGAQLRAFIETRPAWGVLLVGVMIIICWSDDYYRSSRRFCDFRFCHSRHDRSVGKMGGPCFPVDWHHSGFVLDPVGGFDGDFSSAISISFGIERACVPRLANEVGRPDDPNTPCRGPLIKGPHDEFYGPSVFALA